LNSRWTGFKSDLKSNFEKGIDKETLVNYIIEYFTPKEEKPKKAKMSDNEKMDYVRMGQKQ
jgi:hypothetical protein